MPPLVTIGLPVHNAGPFLEDALRSVLAQSFFAWELLVVDDGSTDGGRSQLERLRDTRIRVIGDGARRGLGARLNQIVGAAQGKYIARMDADDMMHPDRIARQVEFLECHPAVDLVGCGVLSFDAQDAPISVRHLPPEHEAIAASPLRGFALAHAAVLGRAEWWRQHPYNESSRGCEDVELWLATHRHSHFWNLPDILYFYREAQSYSFRGYAAAKAELASVLWKQRTEYGSRAVAASLQQWPRIAAYGLAHLVGLDRALVRRRGVVASPTESDDFRRALQRIRATVLPH